MCGATPLYLSVGLIIEEGFALADLEKIIKAMGTALNEIAEKSMAGIKIYEDKIPMKKEVGGACELLGFDPLYLANEGKLLAFVSDEDADAVLAAITANPYGKDATVIGEVIADRAGKVFMETRIGGERIVDMLAGEQLPRIC